jgi:methylmalonyl-CoA mutase N-terminal domain/subunit
MRDRFKARNEESWRLRFHTQTGGSTLTAQQPMNNVVRVTVQALSAVLGGTQSLHTNSMDEALALPTEAAVQVALRTQQILAYESGVADTVDPMAGSYYVESLTDQVEEKAKDYIARIDAMGGAMKAIKVGYIQQEIQDVAYRYQQSVDKAEQVIVGVNKFAAKEETPIDLLRVDPIIEQQARDRLTALRAKRDNGKVSEILGRIEQAARGTDILMPLFVEAVEREATLGEICSILRGVFGEYRPDARV